MNREIFPYTDISGEPRFADPTRVLRVLTLHCDGDMDEQIKLARSENPALAFPAMEQLLAGIEQAFHLPTFDPMTGQGATNDQLLDLLHSFIEWMGKKKVTQGSQPTFPASTETASSSTMPTETDAYPTTLSSACG
jgi:hypothetical protein